MKKKLIIVIGMLFIGVLSTAGYFEHFLQLKLPLSNKILTILNGIAGSDFTINPIPKDAGSAPFGKVQLLYNFKNGDSFVLKYTDNQVQKSLTFHSKEDEQYRIPDIILEAYPSDFKMKGCLFGSEVILLKGIDGFEFSRIVFIEEPYTLLFNPKETFINDPVPCK